MFLVQGYINSNYTTICLLVYKGQTVIYAGVTGSRINLPIQNKLNIQYFLIQPLGDNKYINP